MDLKISNINTLIERSGLTYEKIASIFDLTRSAISQWKKRGQVPDYAYEVLKMIGDDHVRDDLLTPESAEWLKKNYGLKAKKALERFLDDRHNLSEELTKNPLKKFSSEELAEELVRRGWYVNWKKPRTES